MKFFSLCFARNDDNIHRNVSGLNAVIVLEIALGHKYRWHATTKQ